MTREGCSKSWKLASFLWCSKGWKDPLASQLTLPRETGTLSFASCVSRRLLSVLCIYSKHPLHVPLRDLLSLLLLCVSASYGSISSLLPTAMPQGWMVRSYNFLWWRDEGRGTEAHVFWSMRPLFHYQPPCRIQATAHKLATNAIQLYNDLRLTVHLRLLNLKKKKKKLK